MLAVINDCIIFQVFFQYSQNNLLHNFTRHFPETDRPSFLPFLKIKTMFISFQSAETSLDSNTAQILLKEVLRCHQQLFEDSWISCIRPHNTKLALSVFKGISIAQIISLEHICKLCLFTHKRHKYSSFHYVKAKLFLFHRLNIVNLSKVLLSSKPITPLLQKAFNFLCLSFQVILVLKSGMWKRIHTLYIISDEQVLLQHLSSYVKRNGMTLEGYSSQHYS